MRGYEDAGLSGVTSVQVSGYISGCISENTRIRNVYGKDALSSSIDALVGVPVDIESTGDFDLATITFYYSDDVDEENLKILWYDEANNQYVVLSNCVKNTNNNTVSVTTDHFSRYMLIDEGVWVRTWAQSCSATNNYYKLFDWGYDMDKYISWLNQQEDSDGDGLPNCIETNGMINNIGELVYTDPFNPDSDGDNLTDGQEMGLIPKFVIDAVPNIESTEFNSAIPASYFARWSGYVYYSQTSFADKPDSDGDGVNDGLDYMSTEKGLSINYILYYEDRAITGLFGPKEEYEDYFKRHGMDCISVPVGDYNKFEEFWMNIGHHYIEDEGFTNQIEYTSVDNIIIILHGNPEEAAIVLENEYCVWLNKMEELCANIQYDIENVDLQICYGGKYRNKVHGTDYHSFAELFAMNPHIRYVYATSGEVSYVLIVQANAVKDGEQFYRYSDVDGSLVQIPLGSCLFLMERMY